MFDSESKSISTCAVWGELKGLWLNSGVALRKPFISEANWGKNSFNLLESIMTGLWSNGKKVMWPNESWFTLFQSDQGKKGGRWSDAPIRPSAFCTCLWGRGMIWGWISWSGLGSAMLWTRRMRSSDHRNILNDQVLRVPSFGAGQIPMLEFLTSKHLFLSRGIWPLHLMGVLVPTCW